MQIRGLTHPLILFLLFSLLILPSLALSTQAQVNDPKAYIRNDGIVEGTSNIRREGKVYTFTGDVKAALYIEKPGVTVDGAGYTLASRIRGVTMGQDVLLKNLRLEVDGGYVIDLRDAVNCTLEGNTLVGTPKLIPYLPPGPVPGPIAINFLHSQNITLRNNTITNFSTALSLEWSSGHTIVGNTLTDGFGGIDLTNTTGCVFRDNRLVNCSFSMRTYPSYCYENDLDASNTIDGKPIYYWINAQDKTVPSDASYVVLVNCRRITVQESSVKGISLSSTTDSTISRVKMTGRGGGISLIDCTGISILDSKLSDGAISIQLENSSNNIIRGNEISNQITRAINLNGANNNVISGNTIRNNSYGIAPFHDNPSIGNTIESNLFEGNGFAITVEGNMEVVNNTFIDNEQAILCYSGSNTITNNTFTKNKQGLILQSTGNVLRGNRFSGNGQDMPINGANFANDIDSSNMMNGRPMVYWVNQHDRTVPTNAGFVVLVNCSGIAAQNLTLTNQNNGIMLAFTTNSTVTGNLIANNKNGIYLHGASGNRFIGNNITGNGYAVYIGGATFAFYGAPATYVPSSNNLFHHNNFAGNNQTLQDVGGTYYVSNGPSANVWDDGEEGNFWSNYTGVDADGDGVGDTRFSVYANNTDYHPLMEAVDVDVPEATASPSPLPSPSPSATPTHSNTLTPAPSESPSPIQTAAPTTSGQKSSPILEFAPWVILLLVIVMVLAIVGRKLLGKQKTE